MLEEEVKVVKGNKVGTLFQEGKLWKITLDITVKSVKDPSKKTNLLQFRTPGDEKNLTRIGNQIPAINLQNKTVQLCHDVDEKANMCLNIFTFKIKEKFSLRIIQIKKGNTYAYRSFINGIMKFEIPIKRPQNYRNIIIYMSNYWDTAADAIIENFQFVSYKGNNNFTLCLLNSFLIYWFSY